MHRAVEQMLSVLTIGRGCILFQGGYVDQHFQSPVAVSVRRHHDVLATVAVFERVKLSEIFNADIIDYPPDLAAGLRDDIGGAAIAEPRVTCNGKAKIS